MATTSNPLMDDVFSILSSTAVELDKYSSNVKQHGGEQLDLSQLLKNSRFGGAAVQNYFVDKFNRFRVPGVGSSVKWLPAVQGVDCCPVPRAIRSLYSQIECEMFMGLFPEINRAWVTIDNRLFLWNYYKGEDFYVYDGLDQLIVSVGLARPRPGVFENDVEYVLVISTPVEIVLLKLKVIGHPVYGDIELEPTEFNLASDNIPMRSIAGTTDGRVYMAGHDGSLYEFIYETPSMLHSLGLKRQCRKIELSGMAPVKWLIPSFVRNLASSSDPLVELKVDHDRGLLYSLSDKSALSLYKLLPGGGITLVKRIDKMASMVCGFVKNQRHPTSRSGLLPQDLNTPLRIVSLDVIRVQESESIHLVAITQTGIRIYFSTRLVVDGKDLYIEHVRGPPNKDILTARLKAADLGVAGSLASHDGFSTSLLGRGHNMQQQRRNAGAADTGIEPGPCTQRPVSSAMYAGGVTLLSFAPSDSPAASISSTISSNSSFSGSAENKTNGKDNNQQQEHILCGYSTDLSMRGSPQQSGGVLPAFPPLKWQQESFHEVIDVDVLEHGPMLRQNFIEGKGILGNSRPTKGLPVGRVWAMVEATFDPTISDEEELVYAHMVNSPRLTTSAAPKKPTSDNTNSVVGNKRPLPTSSASNKNQIDTPRKNETLPLTELSRQHVLPRRYFLVLTSHGLWVLVKNQPVNQLHALLQGPDPGANADIEEFFKQYGLDESCAMCLAIACRTGHEDTSDNNTTTTRGGEGFDSSDDAAQSHWVSRRAALWFKRIGYGIANLGPDSGNVPQHFPCFPEQLQGNHQLHQQQQEQQKEEGSDKKESGTPAAIINPVSSAGFIHSGCYSGLCLHLARLLRPIWEWSVVVGAEEALQQASDLPILRCRWTPEQISMLVKPLVRLKHFLRTQTPFSDAVKEAYGAKGGSNASIHVAFSSPLFAANQQSLRNAVATPGYGSRRVGLPRVNALSIENDQIARLYQLLDRCIQALLLFEILQTSPSIRFARLVSYSSRDVRAILNSMTWNKMVTTNEGKVVACSLVKTLVEKSPHLVAKDLVSRLESLCPAYFSEGDALQLSAFEEIAMAEQSTYANERNSHLKVALERLRQGFQKTTSNLSQSKVTQLTLKDACEKFEGMGQPESSIGLALYCASCFATQPLDILPVRHIAGNGSEKPGHGNLGMLPSMAAPSAGNRADGKEAIALSMREFSYDLALQIIERSVPSSKAGFQQHKDNKILRQATDSSDALWHFTLYGWLLSKGWKQYLLSIDSQYLAKFLGDPLANDPMKAGPGVYKTPFHVDSHLLLQAEWFARNGNNAKAAQVMQKLATLDVQYREDLQDYYNRKDFNQSPNLEQRVHYLTKALNYAKASQGDSSIGYSSSSSSSAASSSTIDISRLKDELDVAKLQSVVLNALEEGTQRLESSAMADGKAEEVQARHEAIKVLRWTLKNPSDLYNEFAYRFGLWEACIQIMKECNYVDLDELHELYKNVLNEGAGSLRDAELEQLVQPISSALLDLGRKFYNDDPQQQFVFPIEFLVQGLEDLSTFYPASRAGGARREWTPWVLDCLLEIGVPYERVFEAYANYNSKVQSGAPPLGLPFLSETNDDIEWYSEKSKSHVAWAIVTIVRRWQQACGNDILLDASVGDLLERLSVIVGGLHSEDVSEHNRKQLLEALGNLINRIHG